MSRIAPSRSSPANTGGIAGGGGMIIQQTEVDVNPPPSSTGDWRSTPSTVKEKLYNALLTGAFSDVRFTVGIVQKKEIPAHRFILYINSPVFENLLEGAHKTVNVTIADVEPEAFFSFLKFLYTDEFDVHVKDATAVLFLSKKYEVVRLAALCAEFIKGNINTKNVVSVLLSAEALGESSIAYQARYFLRKNIRYVIHEEDFLELNEEELCQIFGSDELSVSELELFNAAVHWAIQECKRQKMESTPQNFRFVLKNVIPLIRFPLMERKEFTLQVVTKGILTDSECLNVMMHWDVSPKDWAALPPPLFSNKPRTEVAIEIPTIYVQESPRRADIDRSFYYDVNSPTARGYRPPPSSTRPPPPPKRVHHHQQAMPMSSPTVRPSSRQLQLQPQPFSYLPDPYTGTISFPQNYAEF